MRDSLVKWISDADALRHLEYFQVDQSSSHLEYIRTYTDDYYLALVGELFERMRKESEDATGWARLGNAIAQIAFEGESKSLLRFGISQAEATLFAATAFYCGGFPASAYLTIRRVKPTQDHTEAYLACFDLLARPNKMNSEVGKELVRALQKGDMATLMNIGERAVSQSATTLRMGPTEWIPARLFERLIKRFLVTNVRSILPDGNSDFWTPFVGSLLNRQPAAWEFFPSQIDAIRRGLLTHNETFSLQMPTGAGKTALCETLLYWHAKKTEKDVAILLVPYRALASELRSTVVKRLNALGISARCAYGGTVPTGDEAHSLDNTRVVVATPEALSGLLGADDDFFRRVSLVICDEGHLLDGGARGVGLELLLARMRAREGIAPRFIFVSAIVPNIEEINTWLGGKSDGVIRSDYRPALDEYSLLSSTGRGVTRLVSLEMHPHETSSNKFTIDNFLSRTDFESINSKTGRQNTYSFSSLKTQAIAAARKALPMGTVAVFAANKRGNQGAVGLAEELTKQLQYSLTLPTPIEFAKKDQLTSIIQYLELEYGAEWLGTRLLSMGAVLHHGDIPQETREILEMLLREGDACFVICTNTLAEGVNFPIRTLVLYSVQRRKKNGQPEPLLARDIKNLVGRAGRAGSTTKGLVICANKQQWWQLEQVAKHTPGEPVRGALRTLLDRLAQFLATRNNPAITNGDLEQVPALYALVDGVDSTLIDLVTDEIGEDALVAEAIRLADQTFAAQQANTESKQLLQNVFELRARRVIGIRSAGRIDWIRKTGARLRMLDAVETGLLTKRSTWDDVVDPIDASIINVILEWVWEQTELQEEVNTYWIEIDNVMGRKQLFFDTVNAWLRGVRFRNIVAISKLELDNLLSFHGHTVSYVLQTLVEQGVTLLAKLLEGQNRTLAPAVLALPEYLRFGVPTEVARILAISGLRHRSAAVALGNELHSFISKDRFAVCSAAYNLLRDSSELWEQRLGTYVFKNSLKDMSSVIGNDG